MGLWVHNASPAVNAMSNYPIILAVSLPLCSLMFIVVSLRFYVRIKLLNRFGYDDLCIVGGAACSIIYEGLTITQTRYGLGLPLAARPAANLNKYSDANFAGRPFYMLGILCFKVALCFSYLRIVSAGLRTYRQVIWGVMIACIAAHFAFIFVLLFNCNPVKKSWRPLTPGTCLPNAPVNLSLSSIVMAFDITIFLLPIPFMLKLQMPNRKKFGLIGIFCLGLFTTICSGLRMNQTHIVAFGDGNSTMLVLWGNVEMNVGLILTSLPALAPLFQFFNAKMSSKGYLNQGPEGHSMDVFAKKGGTTTSKKPVYKEDTHSRSNESQDSILSSNDKEALPSGSILKTVHIDVQSNPTDNHEQDPKTFFDSTS